MANKITGSNEHIKTLVRCCESSGHEGVKWEACRMLALIAKQAKEAGELNRSPIFELSTELITKGR